MGILADIYRRQREQCNGRIESLPGNWVFDPGKETQFITSTDASGREMFLIHKRGVHCSNPDVCSGYPQFKEPDLRWSVPYKVCRKCQHYHKGGTDRLRYPHCQWERESHGGNAGAAQSVVDMMSSVVEKTNNIFG